MAHKRNPIVTIAVLLVTAALCTAGITALRWVDADREQTVADTPPQSGVAVSVAVAATHRVSLEVSTWGFLAPFEELTIAAEVSGPIESQSVDVSDRVSKGDTLFQIDKALHAVALDKALAEKERAASDFRQARENANRVQGLQATESANPMEVLDVQTALDKAKAMVKWADATVNEARILLHKTTIASPLDGVVARIHTRQGEYAHVGQPLVDIIVTGRLKLTVQLEDREVIAFTTGDPVTMIPTALPGKTFDGRILRIYPRATLDSRKFEVEIELPNPQGQLRPGFFAQAKMVPRPTTDGDAAAPEVLTIPRLAVLERYRQQYCYVIRRAEGESADRASLTPIETLAILTDPQNIQVVSGLQAGDRVVTTGLQHVTHGCAVRVVE